MHGSGEGALMLWACGAQLYLRVELNTAAHSSLQDLIYIVILVLLLLLLLASHRQSNIR